jgi:hypothetical protein
MEGGPVASEVDQVVRKAAADMAASAETLLRAGLEELRRIREEEALAEDTGPSDPRLPL